MDVKVTSNSDEVKRELQAKVDKILEAWGLTAEGYAKLATPVDTGRLRNSISHDRDEDSMYVGTNVEYAPYVEFGHHNYQGAHMLRDSIQDHRDEYEEIAKVYLNE